MLFFDEEGNTLLLYTGGYLANFFNSSLVIAYHTFYYNYGSIKIILQPTYKFVKKKMQPTQQCLKFINR